MKIWPFVMHSFGGEGGEEEGGLATYKNEKTDLLDVTLIKIVSLTMN